MMLCTVRISVPNQKQVHYYLPVRFAVLMAPPRDDTDEGIEVWHDEVRGCVRTHPSFKQIKEALPFGYRMDVEVVQLNEHLVGDIT